MIDSKLTDTRLYELRCLSSGWIRGDPSIWNKVLARGPQIVVAMAHVAGLDSLDSARASSHLAVKNTSKCERTKNSSRKITVKAFISRLWLAIILWN